MSNSQASSRLYTEEGYIYLVINDFKIKVIDNYYTKCIMLFICCCLTDGQDKQVFTPRQISVALGYSPSWGYNKWTYLNTIGFDFQVFFKALPVLEQSISLLVKNYVLAYPLLSPLKLYEGFISLYPEIALSQYNFNKYVSALDTRCLLALFRKHLEEGKISLKSANCLSLLVTHLKYTSSYTAKYIKDLAQLSKVKPSKDKSNYSNRADNDLYMFISLLYVSGVSQDDLSKYFGVSKTSIHNYIYRFSLSLKDLIINNIKDWSGKICIDEKWIKVKGQWQYVFTAVDATTGIPLLTQRYRQQDTSAWVAFLKEFEAIYGMPKLIVSDGAGTIASAILLVFKGKTRHQLCWFHKLKNLYKHIYKNIEDEVLQKKAIRLALNSFHNASNRSRKKAARTLGKIDCVPLQNYVRKSILQPWRQLTFCLTSNAAERYNRKIEKAVVPRYGLKNENCADALINLIWFKDILANGQAHLQQDVPFSLDKLQQFAQQETKVISIHFSKNFCPEALKKRVS